MNTTPTNPPPNAIPAARKITPECQPVFPCWVFSAESDALSNRPIGWIRWSEEPLYLSRYWTHWHPDQPEAPAVTPAEPKPSVPQGMREAARSLPIDESGLLLLGFTKHEEAYGRPAYHYTPTVADPSPGEWSRIIVRPGNGSDDTCWDFVYSRKDGNPFRPTDTATLKYGARTMGEVIDLIHAIDYHPLAATPPSLPASEQPKTLGGDDNAPPREQSGVELPVIPSNPASRAPLPATVHADTTFGTVAQESPITSVEGASTDAGPKGTPAQAGEVECPVSNREVDGSSPSCASLSVHAVMKEAKEALDLCRAKLAYLHFHADCNNTEPIQRALAVSQDITALLESATEKKGEPTDTSVILNLIRERAGNLKWDSDSASVHATADSIIRDIDKLLKL